MAFPVNVPNVPGVPSVLFASGARQILSYLTSDALGIFGGALLQQPWGIYLGGAPIILCDNVASFDYRQQWSISDFPVERGAFQSYDKVQIPFDARFRFSAGGSEANRQAFLASIAAVAGDLNLYTVVTPDAIYPSVNITHYDYSRSANNGAGLIVVDVWTLEVRETVGAAMSATQSPTSASQVNGGTVQATSASSLQEAKAGSIRSSGGRLAA
ncbi:hypothetical protein FHX10_003414 [Rhizobium sp. BK591]|uniref:hypothetical protein n=1 Tax=Rhizobium sp. BK591 TaxID=2586985 RepID=UPI001621C015|nr:hypothetical protein [Rhizobium sp. BK591]MBB3743915.1 hypothetical protein [Rhizobium sp. BK591]